MNRNQAENVIGALRVYSTVRPSSEVPNPVLGSLPFAGGTIRVYSDGMLDAIDGPGYSVSPGFADTLEAFSWLERAELESTSTHQGETLAGPQIAAQRDESSSRSTPTA